MAVVASAGALCLGVTAGTGEATLQHYPQYRNQIQHYPQLGDQGLAVGCIQIALYYANIVHHINYGGGNYPIVDNIFGNATLLDVREFQAFFGLKADGIVGPDTGTHIMDYLRTPWDPYSQAEVHNCSPVIPQWT